MGHIASERGEEEACLQRKAWLCVCARVCVLPSLQLCIDLQLLSDASSGQLKVFLMDWTGQYNQSACLDCSENRSPGRAAVYHRKVRKGAA